MSASRLGYNRAPQLEVTYCHGCTLMMAENRSLGRDRPVVETKVNTWTVAQFSAIILICEGNTHPKEA